MYCLAIIPVLFSWMSCIHTCVL